MSKKKIIRKIFVLVAWSLVLCGITTLLVAANGKEKFHVCKEVHVSIKTKSETLYVEKDDVLLLLERSAHGSLVKRPVDAIDLSGLEKSLEGNSWIKNAELYFDSKDALHVFVEEREPVARIFTNSGMSFYIDSSGQRMPLLEKISARVPVVTGFPNVKKMNGEDSVLLNEVKHLAVFISNDKFWNAQIGQIDITREKKFELIPVVGDHIIRLGDAESIREKLNRLHVFYKQVLSKVGFDKYAALDLQYEGQVVAVNRGPVSAVDSGQLQRNIEALLNKANLQDVDAGMLPGENPGPEIKQSDSNAAIGGKSVSTKTSPNPVNPDQRPAVSLPASRVQSQPHEKPKAVMTRRSW